MLTATFSHLPGIGPGTEKKLADAGVFCWEDALNITLPCSPAKQKAIREGIEESRRRLEARDARWFGQALPAHEQWRLFPHFSGQAAYVDIETSGLHEGCHITTIALYDGRSVRLYVHGDNLEDFADDILPFKLLVTWNGRCFDAPLLRRSLHIPLDKGDMAHLDLLPVYRKLGFRGGLKRTEARLGLCRDELDGVDGLAAVWLWQNYERSGDRRCLETLLAYNAADVLGLEFLAEYALALLHPRPESPPPSPESVRKDLNPFAPHPEIIARLRKIY